MDPEKLKQIPTHPGVYLFRDEEGEVLYVGKAKSLRPRVRSYLRPDPASSPKTRELVRRIRDVDTIVVGSEAEALILEANLIKEHRPRFNLQLRDDKRYPYIKVTVNEPFPRIIVTRRLRDDGARYFGPFTSVGPIRQALEVIGRVYTVRSCRYDLPREAPDRPCLDHHIGRCQAPCVGLQSEEEYRSTIDEVLRVLDGEVEEVRRTVEVRMRDAAEALRFEEAARHKATLEGLDSLARQQRVHRAEGGDRDVVGLARDGDRAVAVVLKVRRGTLLGRESHDLEGIPEPTDEALMNAFASGYYLGGGEMARAELPPEILVPVALPDAQALEEVLTERSGRKVRIHEPLRGEKKRLVDLANDNARHLLEEAVAEGSEGTRETDLTLYDLQDRLDLKVVPRLVICFDISHHQGKEVVGSAVVFENGVPKRSEYRHMKIRGQWGNDDVRSMEEVVQRTLSRRRDEERPIPELLVVDGGLGQLGAAGKALEELGLSHVAAVALAKREEEILVPGSSSPLRLSPRDPALHLLQRLRNEAHRFANSYNRKLRGRRTVKSALDEVPGVGPKRRKELLSRFGSVRRIAEADPEEIARLPGFSETLAHRVAAYLRTP